MRVRSLSCEVSESLSVDWSYFATLDVFRKVQAGGTYLPDRGMLARDMLNICRGTWSLLKSISGLQVYERFPAKFRTKHEERRCSTS